MCAFASSERMVFLTFFEKLFLSWSSLRSLRAFPQRPLRETGILLPLSPEIPDIQILQSDQLKSCSNPSQIMKKVLLPFVLLSLSAALFAQTNSLVNPDNVDVTYKKF